MQSIAAFFPRCFVEVGRDHCGHEFWAMELACSYVPSERATWSFPPVTTSAFEVLMICAWTGDREGQEQEISGQGDQMWVISLSLLLDYV